MVTRQLARQLRCQRVEGFQAAGDQPPVRGEARRGAHVQAGDIAGQGVVAELGGEQSGLLALAGVELPTPAQQRQRVGRIQHVQGDPVKPALGGVSAGEQLGHRRGRAAPGVKVSGADPAGHIIDDPQGRLAPPLQRGLDRLPHSGRVQPGHVQAQRALATCAIAASAAARPCPRGRARPAVSLPCADSHTTPPG